MKLTIEKKPLLDAIDRAASVCEKRTTIPILAYAKLVASKDRLTVVATDLDIEVTSTVESRVEAPGSVTASAAMLRQIVGKFPNGALVAIEESDGMLKISAGRSRYELNTLPVSDYPDIAGSTYQASFTAQADELARMLNLTKGAASTEETRYYLNGVYLHNSADGSLSAVATDGHRLHWVASEMTDKIPGVIVPSKTVNEVVKALDIGDVVVSVSETKIKFDLGVTVIVSKVIDGTFPEYARIIPRDNDNIVTASSAELKAASDRVAMVVDDRAKAVKMEMQDGVLVLSAQGSAGNAVEEVPAQCGVSGFYIGMNAKYLASTLSQCGGKEVTMEVGGVNSPVVVRPSNDDNVMYIIMPMRV